MGPYEGATAPRPQPSVRPSLPHQVFLLLRQAEPLGNDQAVTRGVSCAAVTGLEPRLGIKLLNGFITRSLSISSVLAAGSPHKGLDHVPEA